MEWIELKKCILLEYQRRNLKSNVRINSLNKIEIYLKSNHISIYNHIERLLKIEKQDFKKLYEQHKGSNLSGADSSAINEIYNQLIINRPTVLSDLELKPASKPDQKDEHYVLNICDKVLKLAGSRQHRFDFLVGDKNDKSQATKLPVDSFYKELNLVIEYRERQHTESIAHFDKPDKMTVSGVHRGEQRKIYDERRRIVLPKHGIDLVEISYSDFNYDREKRIIRNPQNDLEIVKRLLSKYL